jgi:Carboxypeptidase regulatory-like domain/TonB dependent receptor
VREWRNVVRATVLLVACGYLAAPVAHAQVLYGSIVGNVQDSSGAALPGATVTITSKETNLTRSAVTNEIGTYSLTNVLAGTYDVKVSLQGFKEYVKTDVPVTVNTVSRVDAALDLGQLTETVTVQSESQLLQTDKADTHTEFQSAAITKLPLTQLRNYQSLINLVPGATPAGFQNSEVDTPGRALTTNVNGMDRNTNGTKTDGATNVNIWLPHHTMYVAPAETIDTVNVSTSNFDAEQGNAGGAAITVITKSGTNEFKGSAFAYYNDEAFNAKAYFATEKPKASSHIDGVTLGGPIARNKLFFFGAWEGQYQRTPTQVFYNVPTALLRAGDFSQALNPDGSLQVIYDPLTGNPDGTGRTPFPNNIIPANRFSHVATMVQDPQYMPLPNTPGDNSNGTVAGENVKRNFVRQQDRKFDRNNYDFKVNYNISPATQVWGKYSRMGADVTSPQPYLGYDGALVGETTVQMYTFGNTWTINPTMVFDATLGISKMTHNSQESDIALGNFGLETLGIPGMNGGANFSSDPRYAGFPAFCIGASGCWSGPGFSTVGNLNTWDPVERDERTYAFASNLTKLKGAHEFRFGYSVNKLRMDHWQPELGYGPRGFFQSATNATALNAIGAQSPNHFNAYAAFLLGLSDAAGTSVQYELMTTREWQHNMFARDRWQVSDKLTLDLGLRYEYYPLMTRADRGIEKVDGADDLSSARALASNTGALTPDADGVLRPTVLLGGKGDIPKDLGISVSKTLFAPRLGAVYRINENNVARAGYGITYNPLPFSRPLRGFYPLTLAAAFYPVESYGYNDVSSGALGPTFDSGIPNVVGPDLSSGRLPLAESYQMRTPAGDVSRSRLHSWNIAFERRLFHDISVDVAYVGTAKNGGFTDIDANASDVPGGGAASRPLTSIRGNSSLLLWGPFAKSRYHSLQVAVNRPFKNGLLLKGAYTLSRAKNEVDDDGWSQLQWSAPSLRDRNYALAGYDRPHIFNLAFVYELPYKVTTAQNKVLGGILGDWQVNGIYTAVSGLPFTITANSAQLDMPGNAGQFSAQTANLNGEYKIIGDHGTGGYFFDPAPFSQPQGVVFGNTGRNQFRGPGYQNMDFSIFRAFPIGAGAKRLEFRAEFFNLTNTPKWGNPNGDVTSTSFGRTFDVGSRATIARDGGTGGNAGNAGAGERQIRFGLRFQF